eukprot:TRINITY_DN64642_c0_g1_i1.p1 TRINITY_DN64642_c0_g1~~TRINITY_DN64642_c0_g1_i1.p1  ORF type:complete len:472 (-),score=76.37 TRINITY_DN64642_c0_g1_i1:226-1641(-)
MQFDGGADEFFAKYERFHGLFSQLVETTADKFSVPEPEVCAPELSAATHNDELDAVHVDYCAGFGHVLLATRCLQRFGIVLREGAAFIARSDALACEKSLQELRSRLPAKLDLNAFEAHLDAAPESVIEQVGGDKDLLRLYMVFRVNGMQWGRHHCALLNVASKVSHSCNPNSVFTVDAEDDNSPALRLTARAVRDVEAGEQITFSYLDDMDDLLCPASIRRRRLQAHKYFVCQCARCALSDKGGDRFRGFPCRACGQPVVALERPTVSAEDASRYQVPSSTFRCLACDEPEPVDPAFLELEQEVTRRLETLRTTLGDFSASHIATHAEMAGNDDIFGTIEELYHLARPLGTSHWLTCRISLLLWRARLARADTLAQKSQHVAPPDLDVDLLSACIRFVALRCPEILDYVAVAWIIEAAQLLYSIHWSTTMIVYPLFVQYAKEWASNTVHSSEAWYTLFEGRARLNVNEMD